MLSLIFLFVVSLVVTILIATHFYTLGRKHGIVVGRAQLAKELSEQLDVDRRNSYEMGYSRGHADCIQSLDEGGYDGHSFNGNEEN